MSEKQLKLIDVKKEMAENTKQIKAWNLNALMSENMIKTNEKMIAQQNILHNDILNKLNLAIDRAVKNAKISHDNLNTLIKEKEALHLKLKATSHLGMVQCSYCKKYYTSQGLSRHQTACSMKPEVKAIKKHEKEIVDDKKGLADQKASLEKEIAALEKKKKAMK